MKMGEIPEHFQNTSSGEKEVLSLESMLTTTTSEGNMTNSSESEENGLPPSNENRLDVPEKQPMNTTDLENGRLINYNQEDGLMATTNLEGHITNGSTKLEGVNTATTNNEDGQITTTNQEEKSTMKNDEECSVTSTNLQKYSEVLVDETPLQTIKARSLTTNVAEEEFITANEDSSLTTTCEDVSFAARSGEPSHSSSNGLGHNSHNSVSNETLSSNGQGQDVDEQDAILLLERRSFRPFKSSEDYLYAMREDLAEWLNGLYGLNITVHNFFETLENGVLLCQHTNNVRRAAEDFHAKNQSTGKKFSSRYHIPPYEVHYRRDSAPGSFFARDNVHNFIKWCRDLGVHDVLMFETDDLVLRKNEKHVILALLEIARRGARFGMPAPLLVQMEADIDREIEKDRLAQESSQRGSIQLGQEGSEQIGWAQDGASQRNHEPPNLIYGPQPQVVTNDLMSLDEMVRDLVERCKCPSQFPMIKVSEGKYRIGDTKVLIFVRILRNHVMVRVGGGWDTLHHYLDKHDPCRCKAGHRATISSKVGFKTPSNGDRHLSSVTYERTEDGYPSSPGARRKSNNGLRRDSGEGKNSLRHRSHSPALRENGPGMYSPRLGGRKEEQAVGASNGGDMWCDSSSEVSDEGYKSQGPPRPALRTRRMSPKKLGPDLNERPDSSMTQLSSEGSSASADDIGTPSSPAHCTNTASNAWNLTVPKPGSHIPRSSPSKNKSSFVDSLLIKKPKSKSVVGDVSGRRTAWNAGPGVRSGNGEPRSRRSSISDSVDGRKISRSRSATSEGGFQNMLRKDSGTRQSMRGALPRSSIDVPSGKNTWNGRSRQRDYPNLAADAFRPPIAARSIRSASASPAATRKVFTSSAPSTPVNRSPKRFNNSPNLANPAMPPEILGQFPDLSGDGDAEILVQLEGFVNNYRAYVLDKLAAEGRSLPPELAAEEWDKESSRAKLKANPRKAGLGSRIPAPVF